MGMDLDYDLQALKDGIPKIDKNIEVFYQAIADAEAEKAEYRRMISVLEEKKIRLAALEATNGSDQ